MRADAPVQESPALHQTVCSRDVLAHKRHQPRDRPFVRVSRNEALPLEIVRRFLAQLHRLTDSRAADDRVTAIEEVADPSGARFEHYHLEFREALEDSGLEECSERMLYAMPGKQVEVPCRPAELIVTMVDTPRRRFERRMDRERYVVILRYREDAVVRRVAVRPARKRERRDERAAASVLHRALEFTRGFVRVTEREMRNRYETPA